MTTKYPPLTPTEILGLDPSALVQILKQHLKEATTLSDVLAAAITAETEKRYLGNLPLLQTQEPPRNPFDR